MSEDEGNGKSFVDKINWDLTFERIEKAFLDPKTRQEVKTNIDYAVVLVDHLHHMTAARPESRKAGREMAESLRGTLSKYSGLFPNALHEELEEFIERRLREFDEAERSTDGQA